MEYFPLQANESSDVILSDTSREPFRMESHVYDVHALYPYGTAAVRNRASTSYHGCNRVATQKGRAVFPLDKKLIFNGRIIKCLCCPP